MTFLILYTARCNENGIRFADYNQTLIHYEKIVYSTFCNCPYRIRL